jgi:hypothetical protein
MNQAEWYVTLRQIASDPGLGVRVRLIAAQWLRAFAPKQTDEQWHQHWHDIDNDLGIENGNNK